MISDTLDAMARQQPERPRSAEAWMEAMRSPTVQGWAPAQAWELFAPTENPGELLEKWNGPLPRLFALGLGTSATSPTVQVDADCSWWTATEYQTVLTEAFDTISDNIDLVMRAIGSGYLDNALQDRYIDPDTYRFKKNFLEVVDTILHEMLHLCGESHPSPQMIASEFVALLARRMVQLDSSGAVDCSCAATDNAMNSACSSTSEGRGYAIVGGCYSDGAGCLCPFVCTEGDDSTSPHPVTPC